MGSISFGKHAMETWEILETKTARNQETRTPKDQETKKLKTKKPRNQGTKRPRTQKTKRPRTPLPLSIPTPTPAPDHPLGGHELVFHIFTLYKPRPHYEAIASKPENHLNLLGSVGSFSMTMSLNKQERP